MDLAADSQNYHCSEICTEEKNLFKNYLKLPNTKRYFFTTITQKKRQLFSIASLKIRMNGSCETASKRTLVHVCGYSWKARGQGTAVTAEQTPALLLWHPLSLSQSAAVTSGSQAAQRAEMHTDKTSQRAAAHTNQPERVHMHICFATSNKEVHRDLSTVFYSVQCSRTS